MIINNPTVELLPSLKSLWKEAFGDTDQFINVFFESVFSPYRCYCISEDGEAVAALYFFNGECEGKKIAYLYAIATRKSHRGKGLCAALMDYTHKALYSLGYVGAILVPASESLFSFYERLGYKTSAFLDEISVCASDKTTELYEISAEEYSKKRRAMLPQHSLIQEEESLDFLNLLMRFYAGDGFIVAIRLGEDSLSAAEFLGNIDVLPCVVSALGYKSATVRIPGDAIPFAMFYPFLKDAVAPKYLAFAFD